MTFLVIATIYILTLVAIWFICLHELRKERETVTVKDVADELEWQIFVPIVNTISLLIAVCCWLVWDVCQFNKLWRRLWDKIKDKEL